MLSWNQSLLLTRAQEGVIGTLDYPPFFAWFEYLLSLVAPVFDSRMLELSNVDYASQATVLFQRLSVIVADIALYIFTLRQNQHRVKESSYISARCVQAKHPSLIRAALFIVLFNPGLLIVDRKLKISTVCPYRQVDAGHTGTRNVELI